MQANQKNLARAGVLGLVVVVGLAARMWMATMGYNYDMGSWMLAADTLAQGGCVYAETDRYNYGPVWFWVIHGLDVFSRHHHEGLRYLAAGFLSLVDLGIFLVLFKLAGRLAAVLFFLNPISIIITGYHCQFDNFAILLALVSVWLIGDNFDQPLNRRKYGGLLLLGLSLATKHLFCVFPVWLAVKQKGWRQKIAMLLIPPAIFALSFVPYWSRAGDDIVRNVFCFQPRPTNFFYQVFVPTGLQHLCDSQTLWLAAMLAFAFVCRPRKILESLRVFAGLLLALSPYTCNEYLVIPMALAAVHPSVLFAAYILAGTIHLCSHPDGPQLLSHPEKGCLWLAAEFLCGAMIWHLWRPRIQGGFEALAREFQIQVGWPK
jgi:hypothetical protein